MAGRDYFKRIEKKYGLTREGFLRMLIAQESKCAICDRELVLFSSDRKEVPCVDHHHTTLAVRQLLCMTCNITVGYLEKDEYRTYSALAYLGNPQDNYPRLRDRAVDRAEKRRLRLKRESAEIDTLMTEMEKLLTNCPAGAKL